MPSPAQPPVLRTSAPAVTVIVPTVSIHADVVACWTALLPQLGEGDEFIVVVDGDGSPSREGLPDAVRVIGHAPRRGPAFARNRGAEAASGEVLFFVDADCVAAPDALVRVRAAFAASPDLDALVGSYDDAPAHPSFLSQYRNLLHHFTHQTAAESLSTFWGACGAVRARAFAAVGGFDETYTRPCIEDVELGYRLRRAGHAIRIDKKLRVKHRKAWPALGMLQTDLFRRAIPWTGLLLQNGTVENNLNVDVTGRLSVALVGGVALSTVAAFWVPPALALAVVLSAAFYAVNMPFYRFLRRARGRRFALRAAPWHALYYACAGLGFALGALRHAWTTASSLFSRTDTSSTYPTIPCPTYSSREPDQLG